MIKPIFTAYRRVPETVVKRIRALKLAYECESLGAVIGMGIARLEGGYGCVSCGAYVGQEPQRPPTIDSNRWPEIAEKHVQGCRWIATKGFQIPR